jgi:ATP-dependent Clp protease adaptor protein ClpS
VDARDERGHDGYYVEAGLLRRFASLRKRCAFVAGNDERNNPELVNPERLMLVFSQNLSQSLSRAIAQAEQHSYPCATPEHVLLALLDDPDAVPVMRACNVDPEKLRSAVLASMPHWAYTQDQNEPDGAPDSDEPDDEEGIPVEHFQIVLERAVDHAKSSENEEVNSADVLVAMLERPVGELMNEHGLTRYDVTTFICHGISKDEQARPRGGNVVSRSGAKTLSGDTAGSSMSRVQLLNDDYTPMDFVVHVLEEIFELENEDAERVMLEIHREGAGTCGSFTREGSEARAARVMDLAREHQHPLRCRVLE